MTTKNIAKKLLAQKYGGTLDTLRTGNDQRSGADSRQPTTPRITAYELEQQKRQEARERDQLFQANMRERFQGTIAAVEEQEAREAREQAAADEAAWRADELQRYLASGGSERDFNDDWPRLRQTLVEQAYLSNRSVAPGPISIAQKTLGLLYGTRGA